MLSIAAVNISANLCLVVLMCKTEKRTLQKRRPEYDLLMNTPTQGRAKINDLNAAPNGPYIRVKIKRKLVDQVKFTLRIQTHEESHKSYNLEKKYSDFEDLQRKVVKAANRQNAFF